MATVLEHPHEHEDEHGHHGPVNGVYHHYEDIDQQNESYQVGMWTFLITEVMFFGALFLVYTLYRLWNQETFYLASHHLNRWMGGGNTVVLLISSFTMVLAVHYTQLKKRKLVLLNLGLTVLCACIFLVVKYFEYAEKIHHNLVPGPHFVWTESNPNAAQLFFSLYFTMTGLHGVHVLVGILVIAGLAYLHWRGKPNVTEDYLPTEMVALYWHFVDLVWIFLFPLYYLIPKHH
jgi:cytochrome c oxidase subunit 3